MSEEYECPHATAALSNHLILAQIFRHLDQKCLLQFSVVNKFCCRSARTVLRSKRCLAYIKGADPCHELISLNDTISRSCDVPYTGLAITCPAFCPFGFLGSYSYVALDISQAYSFLLKMRYRHLKINWYKDVPACAAQSLLIRILKDHGKDLIELKISAIPYQIDFLGQYIGIGDKNWLRNLKILDVSSETHVKRSVKHELIQAAPQLDQFGCGSSDDIDFLLENNKASLITEFIFPDVTGQQHRHTIDNCMKFAAAASKVTRLVVTELCDYFKGDTRQLAEESFKQLLKSISSSLEKIRICYSDLVIMMLLNPLKPLIKVGKLELVICNVGVLNAEFATLERLDWVRWFPCLKMVYIQVANKGCSSFINASEYLWGSIRFTPCTSVQNITISQSPIPDYPNHSCAFESFGQLNNVFPNVKAICIDGVPSKLENVLKLLWKWPHAESITLKSVNVHSAWYNKDSLFCGITKKQVRCYMRESVESLQKIGLPEQTSDSLFTLKRLKLLRIEFYHPGGKCRWLQSRNEQGTSQIPYPWYFFLTHVTGVLAFSRMLELTVEVVACNSGCIYNLEQLRPFVSLTHLKGKKCKT